jgi:hypothetical protein
MGGLVLFGANSCNAGVREEAQAKEAVAEASLKMRADAPIGVATQEPNGTIVLQLRAEQEGFGMGDAQFRYATTDKDYAMVARHVGPIPRGGSVPVKPFTKQ